MSYIKSMLYAHGLGGSPQSAKAELVRQHFGRQGIQVHAPALSVPSLEHLSPVAACRLFHFELQASGNAPCVLVASSFGAFIALHALRSCLPEQLPVALILLAPVIDPWCSTAPVLSPFIEEQWRERGSLPVMDLARQVEVPVHYRFLEELRSLGPVRTHLHVPTLIVHGRSDAVVSVEQSRVFVDEQSNISLVTVDDDHSLLGCPGELMDLLEGFLGRCKRV